MKDTILKLEGLEKSFGQTKAVRDISMELCGGQVLGLVGENGSGKSTLMSMVSGALHPDGGKMYYRGAPYHPKSCIEASKRGICILIQETGTINGLTVAENIFIGKEDRFSKGPWVNGQAMNLAADQLLARVGAENMTAKTLVDELSFEERKLVEVCRALSNDPDILIIDETTTALSHKGRQVIYSIIRELKENNKAVVFISHDLEEVQSICDAVVVLRDGCYVDTLYGTDIQPQNMRMRMIGRELTGSYYRDEKTFMTDRVVLEAIDISCGQVLRDISFQLHEGEILGVGGLTECGMHELCKAVFGAIKKDSGKVICTANETEINSPAEAISNGIAYLPKDRDTESLFLATSIKDNIAVISYDNIKRGKFIFARDEKKLADHVAEELSIKMRNTGQLVKELSGGNKQKVVVAKWLAKNSNILIMDCPTRGIDIGVKAAIYSLMESMISQKKAIIMVSEEITELLAMSDNVLIMKDGTISGRFSRDENITEQMLIDKMI